MSGAWYILLRKSYAFFGKSWGSFAYYVYRRNHLCTIFIMGITLVLCLFCFSLLNCCFSVSFRPIPTLVESLAYKQVQSIACGAYHTAACVIRAWVHDQETKSCMACKQRFTTVRRRVIRKNDFLVLF